MVFQHFVQSSALICFDALRSSLKDLFPYQIASNKIFHPGGSEFYRWLQFEKNPSSSHCPIMHLCCLDIEGFYPLKKKRQ